MLVRLLTIDETADWLRCSPTTVRSWIGGGELDHVMLGDRRKLIREDDLQAFIDVNTFAGDEPSERHTPTGGTASHELAPGSVPAVGDDCPPRGIERPEVA